MPDAGLADRFRAWFAAAGLGVGDTLPGEVALARRFRVSRAAIREVIQHWARLGVLQRVRNRGTTVVRPDPLRLASDLEVGIALAGFAPAELKETRRLVETAVAGLAARRLTPAAAERLRALIAAMAAESDDAAADSLDRDFHLALVEACGNPCLGMFAGVIAALFHRQHRQGHLGPAAAARSVADHRAILAALEAGDAAAAQQLLAEHIART